MRVIGLDIHRTFAEVMFLEGGELIHGGPVELAHSRFSAFARTLRADDEVVLEATGNTIAVVRLLEPHVGRVVIANPLQVRAIAHAKIKTDKIDAAILAQLHASGFLPEVWRADEATLALRRQVARRSQIVRQCTRLKNQVQSVLHAYLIPRFPGSDLFGKKGRAWLSEQPIPADERLAIERRLREPDRLGEDLAVIEKDLARFALKDADCQRLLTVAGINMAVAVGIKAAVDSIERFSSPQKLVSYFGLNPSVRQADDNVIRVAHDNHVTRGLAPSPALGPEVEDVVQVDIGEQRRDYRALRGPDVTDRHGPVFQDARPQPFPDQADDARITDPVLHETDQPCLVDRVEEAPDIRIENVVHLPAADPDGQGIQRIMLAALWSESIREPEEILLVDCVQHRRRRPLDDLVLKGGDRERASPAIRLEYVTSPGRLRPVCSPLDPCVQSLKVALEIRLVVPPAQPVYAGRSVPLKLVERKPEQIDADMVEERGEPFLLPLPCGLSYAFQRL
jgi:transposase